jgi:prophage regulatory protein
MVQERLLRLPAVESLTGLKRAHLYGLARKGQFPRPLKIGARASAWQASEVHTWIADRIREAKEGQQ